MEIRENAFPVNDEDLCRLPASKQLKSNSNIFDPFFGIKVVSPRFSLETFNTYCGNLMKIKLSAVTQTSSTIDAVIMGVIVQNTGIKKSSNGNEYISWYLSNLKTDKKLKLLLFGEAAQAHWKLQAGCVVVVTNAETVVENCDNSAWLTKASKGVVTLKVQKAFKVFSLGFCPDYGVCASLKKDGNRCSNYVNLSNSSFCIYHIQSEANKFRSLRGSLSAISNERPSLMKRRSGFY